MTQSKLGSDGSVGAGVTVSVVMLSARCTLLQSFFRFLVNPLVLCGLILSFGTNGCTSVVAEARSFCSDSEGVTSRGGEPGGNSDAGSGRL